MKRVKFIGRKGTDRQVIFEGYALDPIVGDTTTIYKQKSFHAEVWAYNNNGFETWHDTSPKGWFACPAEIIEILD